MTEETLGTRCPACFHLLRLHDREGSGCSWRYANNKVCDCFIGSSGFHLNDYGRNNPALYMRESS